MLRPTVFALLACLMSTDAIVFDYTFGCHNFFLSLVESNTDHWFWADDSGGMGRVEGPLESTALKVEGSLGMSSAQLLQSQDEVLRTIALNFKLFNLTDPSAQGATVLEYVVDSISTIKIVQNGEDITISLQHATNPQIQVEYTRPAPIGEWKRIHITTSVEATYDPSIGTKKYDQLFYDNEKLETPKNILFGADGYLTLSSGIVINSLRVSTDPDGDDEDVGEDLDSGNSLDVEVYDCYDIPTITCSPLTSCPSSVDFHAGEFDYITFTCKVTPYTIDPQGQRVAGTTTTTDPVFMSLEKITCAVTPGVSAEVTLSGPTNHEIVKGTVKGTGKVNAYPMTCACLTCLLCSEDFTESCTAVAGTCFINNECMTDQALVTSDPPKICDAKSPFVATDPPSKEDVNDSATSCDNDAISVGALAQPSDVVNFNFFARIPCEGDRTLLTSDNLNITQEENTIKVSIQFEGEEEPRNAEIDLLNRKGKPVPSNWRRECHADMNTCQLFIEGRHNVLTGTQLKINGKEPEDPEEKFQETGLQLSLNGLAFGDADNVVACLHYNNIDDSCGDTGSIRECKEYVCANKKCPKTTP